MAFKLSEQLDHIGDPNLSFEMYRSYVEENKHRFPESVIELMALESWSGGSSSDAPYYGDLLNVEIHDFGKQSASVKIVLLKQDYVDTPFNIELIYKGLLKLNIPNLDDISEQRSKWRYEEFLFFDPYHSNSLKEKMFTHRIEWDSGNIWDITARDIEVKWVKP